MTFSITFIKINVKKLTIGIKHFLLFFLLQNCMNFTLANTSLHTVNMKNTRMSKDFVGVLKFIYFG